jgi:pimeloyl-ACP methyl ester carboxylesterase
MAWFLVHIPALNVIGWWFLRSSRHLMRWALLREMRYRPDLVTPRLVDELMRLARKRRAGAAFLQWQRREVTWRGLRTLHGENDRLLPIAIAERAHRLIRNSQFEVIPECGHLAPLEQPEAVNRALYQFFQPIP